MKRQSVRLITTALAAAGIAGCFSDPASSLQNGPAAIQLTRSAVYLAASGDSVLVEARLVTDQGVIIPISGATWTTDNAAVADVHVAAQQLPDDGSSKVYILATTNAGGVTTVRISSRGVSDSLRVTQITNTVVPGTSAVVAGDTVTVTAPAGYAWNANGSTLTLGTNTTYLLSRTATVIRALARATYTGAVTVLDITFTGGVGANAVPIASLPTNSVTINKATLPAANVVLRAGTFGANTEVKVTPPVGTKFSASASNVVLAGVNAPLTVRTADSMVALVTSAYTGTVMVQPLTITASGKTIDSLRTAGNTTIAVANLPAANVTVRTGPLGVNTEMKVTPPAGMAFSSTTSNVVLGAANGTKLVATADSIVVISTNAYTGTVKVTNLTIGTTGSAVDSMRTAGNSTIAAGAFPGTIVLKGAGGLLDTIQIIGGVTADFTTSGASASTVSINGNPAFVLRRAADTLYVFAALPGTSAVTVTNVKVGVATVASMQTAATITVGTTSAETNEPGNEASATATVIGTLTNANDTIKVYGVMDGNLDQRDYYKLTMNRASTITVQLDFFGDGKGNSDIAPDFDIVICTTLSGTGSCSYGQDIIPGNAASAVNNPEIGTSAAIASGTTVFIRTFAYYVTAAGIGAYRITVTTP